MVTRDKKTATSHELSVATKFHFELNYNKEEGNGCVNCMVCLLGYCHIVTMRS